MPKRTSKKRKKDDRWGKLVIFLAVVIFIVCAVLVSLSAPPALDAELCPENASDLTGQIAVALDPSDSLHYTQQVSARTQVLREIKTAPEYTEIRLYELSRDERQPARMEFRICAPAHPDQIGWFEGLRKNRDIARRRYEKDFIAPLEQRLQGLLAGSGSMTSPILKTVQDMAVDAFQPPDSRLSRQLILVSDMVQHSEDWSFFRDPVDFTVLAGHPDYPTMGVDLDGMNVSVFFLARRGMAGRIQAGPIREFWDEYFLDQGARQPQWYSVTG